MISNANILLFATDARERARAARLLANSGYNVEPCSDLDELSCFERKLSIVLVQDQGDAVAKLMRWTASRNAWFFVVAYDSASDERKIVKALKCGAEDYLILSHDSGYVEEAFEGYVRQLYELKTRKEREQMVRSRFSRLTEREREVLQEISNGHSSREIATVFGISPRTVEIHRSHILLKLEADNSIMAVRMAIDVGFLISNPPCQASVPARNDASPMAYGL